MSQPNFEESLRELESITARLESGNLSLDESLKAFERGVQLHKQCAQILERAHTRIERIDPGTDPESSPPPQAAPKPKPNPRPKNGQSKSEPNGEPDGEPDEDMPF